MKTCSILGKVVVKYEPWTGDVCGSLTISTHNERGNCMNQDVGFFNGNTDDILYGLTCTKCQGKLHLAYKSFKIKINDSDVPVYGVPILECSTCKANYMPHTTNDALRVLDKLMNNEQEDDLCIESLEDTCIDFSKYKNILFSRDKFISEKVKFLYDKDDYYFIPGLWREYNIGALTPIFFNITVLLKYMHHPSYGIDIAANTYGYIYNSNGEHMISFGINENDRVIMWLLDIQGLDVNEQYYLRSENIPSDHSISSEFYEAQIEVKWAEGGLEKQLLNKRIGFNEKVLSQYNLALSQLDTETIRISKKIQKVILDTEDAFKDLIIPLNELLVEAINNKDIRNYLILNFSEYKDKKEIKNMKGIKLFQKWLEHHTEGIDVSLEIAPLFVLYDLRLVSAHLYPDADREKLLSYCCERIGLSSDERNYRKIAEVIVQKLVKMYEKLTNALITERKIKNDES